MTKTSRERNLTKARAETKTTRFPKPMQREKCKDNTERESSEEALRLSEEKYRTLFETMAQGVVYQNASGEIFSANPAAQRILGMTLEQMQRRTSQDTGWRAIHEDGSEFSGESHPAMVALETGEEVRNVITGVFNPFL